MNGASLVFPHQLFKNNPALVNGQKVFLIEDDLFFTHFAFHKQKLVLHRASMYYYKEYLEKKGFIVEYINSADASLKNIFFELKKQNIEYNERYEWE